jgi:type I restriction enzyme S subunit
MADEDWPSWVRDLPRHWARKRLKHICSRYADYGLNEPASSYTSEGIRFLRTSDIDDAGKLQGEGVYLPKS